MQQIDSRELANARLQAHWAAQVVGSVGLTFGEPVPDFGHTSLAWLDREDALASPRVGSDRKFRAGLRLSDLTLLAPIDDGRTFPLAGRTLEDAFDWLSSRLSEELGGSFGRPLRRFDHDVPDHPVAHGRPFSLEPIEHFRELERWYREAFQLLAEIRQEHPNTSPVRCWPHHFDAATLIQLDPDEAGEHARTVGVGMSPGDSSYPEPYWYVTPWPYPAPTKLPAVRHGAWHTAGWVGAVLRGTQLTPPDSARNQGRVRAFLRSAVSASLALLTSS